MNMKPRLLLAIALVLPAVAAAQQVTRPPLSYTYAQFEYAETEFDGADGDGFTLSGSYELTDVWHAYASYGTADLDGGVDVDTWAIGAGYRYAFRDDIDVYGRLLYLSADASGPGGSADDSGLGIQVRARSRIRSEIEVEGGLQYVNLDDSDLSLQGEGRYYFSDEFSVHLGLTLGGDADGISIGVRLNF